MVVDSFISGFSALSKSSLYIWKFLVQVLLKPSLINFEHYLANLWKEHSILWHGFSLGLEWKLTISSSVATAEFSMFADILSAHWNSVVF